MPITAPTTFPAQHTPRNAELAASNVIVATMPRRTLYAPRKSGSERFNAAVDTNTASAIWFNQWQSKTGTAKATIPRSARAPSIRNSTCSMNWLLK